MNISINAVFRKDRLNSQNAAPVHLRLTQTRKNKFVSTGVTLGINDWDFDNQRIKSETPELQALQLRIDNKIDELRRKIRRLEALEVDVTLDNLLETNGRKINCTVGEYLKQTIERLETLGKYGSASKYRSLLARLSQFRSLNIRFDEIDAEYTLLYFYDPTCDECGRVKERLASTPIVGDMLQSGRLDVLSVSVAGDDEVWRRMDVPKGWTDGRDPGERLVRNAVYDLKAMPTLYLLDPEKRVLLKDASAEQVEEYLVNK